jgi:glutathionylspermidine synthase
MRRVATPPRPNWRETVKRYGIDFDTPGGKPYWDESVCYELSVAEIDDLEQAAQTVHDLCLELVDEIVSDEMWHLFDLPESFIPMVVRSWREEAPSIYGRFDFAFGTGGPPKLLEYNADTPTSLIEAAVAQWFWLKDIDSMGDQFNSIHERLIESWKRQAPVTGGRIAFTGLSNHPEDLATVEYLRDTAIQAGLETRLLDIGDIGHDSRRGGFIDARDGSALPCVFKLYPWEWMLKERYGALLCASPTVWVEPPWKSLLSDKGILPLLWERHPDCPYLLPATFEKPDWDHVAKPRHGREGANIEIVRDGRVTHRTEGPYATGESVFQAWHPLPSFQGRYPVMGCWIVDDVACGLGIREDDGPVTRDRSQFIPHRMIRL